MIVPDINLLLYAYDADSPSHPKASAWWQECLSGEEPVGLAVVVVFGFVRIATHARVFEHPMTAAEAAKQVRSWLEQSVTQILEPPRDHVEKALSLVETVGTAGNLVTDAQIAALGMQYDGVLHTADSHFLRFSALRWFNPLTGARSGRVRGR